MAASSFISCQPQDGLFCSSIRDKTRERALGIGPTVRFGQRIGAFLLDGVLGCHDHK